MTIRTAVLLSLCVVLSGCVEKRQPAGSGETQKVPAKAEPAAPEPAPTYVPQNAAEKYAKTLSTAPAKAATTIDLASIHEAIQQFGAMEGRFPTSLDELVAMRYLPAIPPVPHGKRLSYDPKTGNISLVNE